MKFIIDGETPSKKNQRIINRKTGRSFPSKRYSEWHKNAMAQIFYTGEPVEKCNVMMKFYHGDLRRRDSDNGASSVLDLLTDCGVLIDDNWQVVRSLAIFNEYDKGKPRVEVSIQEI